MGTHDASDGADEIRIPGVDEPSSHDCPPHGTLQLLGADGGNNEYYRCEECRDVIVSFGTRDYQELREEREVVWEGRSWLEFTLGRQRGEDGNRSRSDAPTGERTQGVGDRLHALRRRLFGR